MTALEPVGDDAMRRRRGRLIEIRDMMKSGQSLR